ncbi:MAG: lmo0937 family membrane protein [Chloroflexia bacterium]
MGSLANILWTVVVILVVLWLLGFFLNIAGLAASGFIHILLVIAAIVLVYNLLTGRKGV